MTHVEARHLLEHIRALVATELAAHEATLAPFFHKAARLLDLPDTKQDTREELLALLDDLEEVLEVFTGIGTEARGR